MSISIKKASLIPWLFLGIYLSINLLPILWLLSTSIKPDALANAYPPTLIPWPITFEAYSDALEKFSFAANLRNSLIIALGSTAISGGLGVLAAYSFSRFRFPGDRFLMVLALVARMIAPIAMVVPFLILARYFSLFNSKLVLIIANIYLNLPFVIWLMKSFLDGISTDLDEAALIDGCNHLQAMYKVILPLALPGLAATLILVFLFSWNEFLFAWALTSSLDAEPLTVGLKDVVGEQTVLWSLLSAAGVVTMLPAVIFALLFQRSIVSGLAAGAVKG